MCFELCEGFQTKFFTWACRMFIDQKNVRAGFLTYTLELKLWHFEVFPYYVCMWKPCVCNVSRPLYVSVRYLENSSFWHGPMWFLDIFFCKTILINVMFGALGNISDKVFTCACRMCRAQKIVRAGFLIFTFRLEKQQLLFSLYVPMQKPQFCNETRPRFTQVGVVPHRQF